MAKGPGNNGIRSKIVITIITCCLGVSGWAGAALYTNTQEQLARIWGELKEIRADVERCKYRSADNRDRLKDHQTALNERGKIIPRMEAEISQIREQLRKK